MDNARLEAIYRPAGGPFNCLTPANAMKPCTRAAERGAAAVIPPRKNVESWKADAAGVRVTVLEPVAARSAPRNEALRASDVWVGRSGDDGGAITDEAAQIPTPSCIAAQYPAGQWMHCVKLPGQRLTLRDFDRQVAEFQIRVAVRNGITALGITATEVGGQVRPGKEKPARKPFCAIEPSICTPFNGQITLRQSRAIQTPAKR